MVTSKEIQQVDFKVELNINEYGVAGANKHHLHTLWYAHYFPF